MRRHALFVLGMHRSGTSALTGAIAKAGAHPGATLMPATDDNPEGYWEDATLVGFNDQLLRNLGSRWDSVAPLAEDWPAQAAAVDARAHAATLIAREWGDARFAVVKDPRLCRLLRLWRTAFADAGFIVSCVLMTRRPTDVAASLARRDQFAPEKSLALWLAHLTDAERESRDMPRALVTYEQLLADPAATFERVCVDASFPLEPSPSQRQAAFSLVRPALNRQGARASGEPRGAMESTLDTVLDRGHAALAALAPHVDPGSVIATIAREAAGALAVAMPAWLAHELAAAQSLSRSLADDLAGARNSIATLEGHVETARKAHASRDEIESALRARLASAPVGSEDLAALERALREQMAPLAAALASTQQACAVAAAAERSVREELGRAQRDLANERATISALTAQIDLARIAALDLESQVDTARHHIEDLVRQHDEARRAHAARDDIEAALTRDRDALREEVASLRAAATDASAKFVHDLSLRDAEIGRRAESEREARERIESLERELAASVAEAQALRGQIDVAMSELDHLSSGWVGRVARKLARR